MSYVFLIIRTCWQEYQRNYVMYFFFSVMYFLVHHRDYMKLTSLFVGDQGDVYLDLLIKAVSRRLFHYKIVIFPFIVIKYHGQAC